MASNNSTTTKRSRGRPPKEKTQPLSQVLRQNEDYNTVVPNDEVDPATQALIAELLENDTMANINNIEFLKQIERDHELAKQLAEDSNLPPQGADAGDNIDDVLEQIRQLEEQEKFKGNAYSKKLDISRIEKEQEESDALIRDKFDREFRENERLQLKAIQDAEYEESLRIDREKAKARESMPSITNVPVSKKVEFVANLTDSELPDDVPKTAAELRAARLAFFNKK
jgi:hypothetical protein